MSWYKWAKKTINLNCEPSFWHSAYTYSFLERDCVNVDNDFCTISLHLSPAPTDLSDLILRRDAFRSSCCCCCGCCDCCCG